MYHMVLSGINGHVWPRYAEPMVTDVTAPNWWRSVVLAQNEHSQAFRVPYRRPLSRAICAREGVYPSYRNLLAEQITGARMYPMATARPMTDDSDRRALRELARNSRGGVLALEVASEVLGVPRRSASATLSALARRGWLKRLVARTGR